MSCVHTPTSVQLSQVERVLSDEAALAAVGAAAARKARSWTEDANAEQLTVIVETAMKGQAPPNCAPHKHRLHEQKQITEY